MHDILVCFAVCGGALIPQVGEKSNIMYDVVSTYNEVSVGFEEKNSKT